MNKDSSLESFYNIQSDKSCDHLRKETNRDQKYRKSWYFIFMVAFGRFLQMVARQMAYIIYLIEVSGNKYQKATVLKRILQWQ